jgi:protein-disulfide isomerase
MSRKSKRNQPDSSQPAPAARGSGRSGLIAAIVLGLVVAVVAATLLYRNGRSPAASADDAARQAALASAMSPTLGDAGAKVHVVEFLDPACETCAQFFPIVKQLMAENPGKIRLSVRMVAFHDGSDYVVRLLGASRKQDKYWETLEALLTSQYQWAPNHTVQQEQVGGAIAGVGLNLDQLTADMTSQDVVQNVQRDAADAVTMKVTATPEYFVNGRPLPSFGEQQLLDLVHDELQRAY